MRRLLTAQLGHDWTQLAARYAQLEEVLHAAAGADDELRDVWQTNEQKRLQGARLFIDNLLGKSPLKPGLDREAAVDVLWTHMATDSFRRLVRDRGWSTDQYEQWLAEALCAQLLPCPHRAVPARARTLWSSALRQAAA